MSTLLHWKDLPLWVPGKLLVASDHLGWENIGLRSYYYEGQDVFIPAMNDYLLVNYRRGSSSMQRCFDGYWSKDTLSPGYVSLLTRNQEVQWYWKDPLTVTHLYLSNEIVTQVANEVMDFDVAQVTLADTLKEDDPILMNAIEAVYREVYSQELGDSLYVNSIATAMIVHLLRKHACVQKLIFNKGVLSPTQKRQVCDYINQNLSDPIEISALAAIVNMQQCRFARYFKNSFDQPAYSYVIECRLLTAKQYLTKTNKPIKEIAFLCGFADQPHFTRLFKRTYKVTPGYFRKLRKTKFC